MPFRSDMEVLTLQGWRQWDTLSASENLAVPNPEDRTFKFEKAKIRAFITDEPLVKCTSEHIHFGVTIDHRLHAQKGEKAIAIKAGELASSLKVDTLAGYQFVALEGEKDPKAQLAAFWCGDGYKISKNRIGFGLKKDRKKEYLRQILKKLDITYKAGPHKNRPGYLDFVLAVEGVTKEVVEEYINDWQAIAKNKHLSRTKMATGDGAIIRGFFDALMASDGHVKQDRPQLQFTSTSQTLHSDFQLLSAMLGRDAHFTHHQKKEQTLSYNPDNNRSFELDRISKEAFDGRVYCAETSNGLLFVRGNGKQFGFVAGCA